MVLFIQKCCQFECVVDLIAGILFGLWGNDAEKQNYYKKAEMRIAHFCFSIGLLVFTRLLRF